MNKERYRKALSGVRPSEQSMERIKTMTEKNTKHFKKGWVIAIAAALILVCALFTVNAATDGALFNGTIIHDLKVKLNGQEYNMDDYLSLTEDTTDKDGNPVVKYSYDLPDGKKIEAYAAESYTAFSMDAEDVNSIEIVGKGTASEIE